MTSVYSQKKKDYSQRLSNLLMEYTGIIVCHADNVRSLQLQQVRALLRGEAEILMGKNTQMRRVIREVAKDIPDLQKLLPHVVENVGLVFTNANVKKVKDILLSNRVPAAAKAGTIAPSDVWVPPGPTGLDPGQTSFFQALGIPTKIARGSIEIINDIHLISAGDRVGNSEVALLSKLNIKPFTYGLKLTQVYDTGAIYSPAVLDITETILVQKFLAASNRIAAVCLEIGYPTLASVPHSILNAFKNLVAVSLETDFEFEQATKLKEMMKNPGAFAAPAAGGAAPAAAAPVEVEEESEEDVGGGGLFGSDDDSDSD